MRTQKNVFLAVIKERYCLNPGSEKETYHLVLDLAESGIEYAVGDCLGIYPQNDPSHVQTLIESLKATGEELVEDRQGASHTLHAFLTSQASLIRLPEAAEDLATPKGFCKRLAPLLPRFYSIASSMERVGREAHLTVALIDGTCSHYLCKRTPLGSPVLSIFHQPSHNFSLPAASFDKPIVMIGPGTGIAPFRGFMQERIAKQASEKNWLFFGERRYKTDFYYQSYWEQLVAEGKLELDCAFSRDQEERVYVQHKILNKSAQIWEWIGQGAYIFVCGNASRMAKDVDKTLHAIVEKEGNYLPAEAKAFIKELKKADRYQRDVY